MDSNIRYSKSKLITRISFVSTLHWSFYMYWIHLVWSNVYWHIHSIIWISYRLYRITKSRSVSLNQIRSFQSIYFYNLHLNDVCLKYLTLSIICDYFEAHFEAHFEASSFLLRINGLLCVCSLVPILWFLMIFEFLWFNAPSRIEIFENLSNY